MIDHDIASEARTRVFETATAIYEENGKSKLPTVDQVRRSARVDMNAASALMREWRRNLLGEVKTVTVSIPEGLNSAATNLISELWCKAQALANEAIRAAESAWHVERAEMEFMHKRVFRPESRLEGKVLDTEQIGFQCRACGFRWEVPCE